jgi:hypothetical protein
MKFFGKTLGLLLASLTLASCGGGGGDGGTFTPQSGSITITATATSLPTNTGNWLPSDQGPNQAELTITSRNADGALLIGQDLSVSISPVNVAALSFLVNDDNDSIDNLWGSFTIKGTNGVATAWVNAGTVAGTAVVTASMLDPTTSRTISKTITITVTSGVGTNPATVSLTPAPAGVYLPNSGGNNASSIAAVVLDGGGQFVPDPTNTDNLQVEIVGNAGDARLSTNSAGGAAQGTSVATHTVNGKATVSFQAGDATPQGPVQIKATADRADNNVSNGIQDPVSFTASIVVSDGKLFSIKITSPDVDAIFANPISPDVTALNGTYSLTVSALGTDRQGNPVLPGTPIRFGSIDEPVGTFDAGASANRFLIAGGDGNPQEGGTGFTAPTGHFRTAGGGAGPGDAIIVFGKTQHGAPQGNEDLESALTVGRVNSETSLTTTTPFNNNNTTGSSVDYGPVLDYIVGRSNHGNIGAGALTDNVGVATVTLNYTVETLGHIVAMWAQGDGSDRVTNGSRRVTDAVQLLYPGIAPAQLVAFPSPIPGNTTTSVTVCLADANNSPIQGVHIGYQMNLGGGTGSIDGNGASGTLDNTTGPDGCVDASVVTSGLPVSSSPDSPSGKITFSAAGATAEVDLIVQLGFLSNGGLGRICNNATPTLRATIKAFTTTGDPAGGVQIAATCSGVTVNPGTATTSANGTAVFDISGTADASGTCTFTAAGVAPLNIQVTIPGADDFSPPCGP